MAKSKKPLIIDDESAPGLTDALNPPGFGHGLIERDYAEHPAEMFAPPTEIKLIPQSEWSARIKERKELKATGRDLKKRMNGGRKHVSLDQGSQGYCWFYSNVHTVMYQRAAAGQPYVRLSAHSGACKVKNFRDEGGWCGLGAKFVRENGVVPVGLWPEKSMSRSHDTPEAWAEAKKYAVTEDWVDLTRPVHSQNLTFEMVAACLLTGVFCAVDFNWWAHSVCAIDLEEVEPGSFGLLIQNSWTDNWGEDGLGVLRGSKARPDGAIATRVTVGD